MFLIHKTNNIYFYSVNDIKGMFILKYNIEIILSALAIIISIIGFAANRFIDSILYGPKCRVAVFSADNGRGLEIQFENVGSRIMHVKRISYTAEPKQYNSKKDNRTYYTNLSEFFYSIPCDTRAESRIAEPEYLFPNSKHRLLRTTFNTQGNLLCAWKIISVMTVKVEYCGFLHRFFPTIIELKVNYDIFMDALKNSDGTLRTLKAFK